MARKPNGHDHRPEVIDLRRYRQAAEKQRRPTAPPPSNNRGRRPGQREPFLGPRPNAGMILVLVLVVLLALWILPTLL